MFLNKINILNFKNICNAELAFLNRINCLVGDNGAGKTNVLDAINYLSMCKSAFGLTDLQNINHNADFFMLEGEYNSGTSLRENIMCSFKKGAAKTIKRGGKEYEKLSEHIGVIPVVMVSPSDTSLISDSGEERRRYLNSFISQLDRNYLADLVKYNRLLAERNKLLKQMWGAQHGDILEVIDMQLVEKGNSIHQRRQEIISELAPVVAGYYATLSNDREKIELTYRSELSDRPFAELLEMSKEKDRVNQFTTVGIHRDDMKMSIGGFPLRKYGSQGQQKSFLVALKLAQYEIVTKHKGKKPLLLLDDIFDKLDIERVEQLLSIVSDDKFGQIFITDCNKVRLEDLLGRSGVDYSLFNVKDGEVSKL